MFGFNVVAQINDLIVTTSKELAVIMNILPNSPFNWVLSVDATWFKALNWFFPVDGAVAHLTAFTTAVGGYFILRIAMRWMKAAQS